MVFVGGFAAFHVVSIFAHLAVVMGTGMVAPTTVLVVVVDEITRDLFVGDDVQQFLR